MIEDKEEEETDIVSSKTCCLFPRLQEIWMVNLPKLESFCEWRCALELPSLKILSIRDCPEMTSFSTGSIVTPHLQTITINDTDLESVQDWNGSLWPTVKTSKTTLIYSFTANYFILHLLPN